MAEKGLPAPKIPPTPKATRSKISDQTKPTDLIKRRELLRKPLKQNPPKQDPPLDPQVVVL